jgi:hypothetical protein
MEALAEIIAGAKRTSGAAQTARLIAASNSSGMGGTMVLSSFGRLSVIVAIGPSLL